MKNFFAQNKVIVGIVAGLGAELSFCLALAIGLLVAGEPILAHIRWFAGMFFPLVLVLHHYAKGRTQLRVTKTLIVVFFITFLAFMIYLLKSNTLVLQ